MKALLLEKSDFPDRLFVKYLAQLSCLIMGASESKEEKEEREQAQSVYDTRYISWDETGNLRYGITYIY